MSMKPKKKYIALEDFEKMRADTICFGEGYANVIELPDMNDYAELQHRVMELEVFKDACRDLARSIAFARDYPATHRKLNALLPSRSNEQKEEPHD